jgi:prepilin-type N-terminal cleavage/methylation domain-containing protein
MPRARRAFTLLEIMMVLLVLTVLLAGMAIPLATQVAMRRYDETRRTLDDAREALLGFASAHGRLPCPASATSRGEESFAPGGDALNGRCSNFHDGYLPAASLGLAPLDGEGYLRDAWMSAQNRVRYAVFAGEANGIAQPLTRVNGMKSATLAGLGAAPNLLWICASGTGVDASGCGAAANHLTRRAAFVLISLGADAPLAPAAGSDEAKNLDGDGAFVSHEISATPGNEFDDYLTWVTINLVVSRLVTAGRLP